MLLARPGDRFVSLALPNTSSTVSNPNDYAALLASTGSGLTGIVHLWNMTPPGGALDRDESQDAASAGLLALAPALGRRDDGPLEWLVVCNEVGRSAARASGRKRRHCSDSVRVISKEYPHICCRRVDIGETSSVSEMEAPGRSALPELLSGARGCFAAYRGPHRWVQELQPVQLPAGDAAPPPQGRRSHLSTGKVSAELV